MFGERLRTERKKQNISAEELALKCGLSRSYITLIENGKRFPSKKIIPQIAAALGLKPHIVVNWYLADLRASLTK